MKHTYLMKSGKTMVVNFPGPKQATGAYSVVDCHSFAYDTGLTFRQAMAHAVYLPVIIGGRAATVYITGNGRKFRVDTQLLNNLWTGLVHRIA